MPAVQPLIIALYEDQEDTQPYRDTYETWEEFVEMLTVHERTNCDPCPGGKQCKAKNGKAWSPGVPREGTERKNENVEFNSLLSYDFDHLTADEADGVFDRLAGVKLVAHSSHSHLHGLPGNEKTGEPARAPADDYCFRVAVPLTRPLKPAEYQRVRQAFIDKYSLRWTRPQQPWQKKPEQAGADPARKDTSGLYFLPSAPKGVKDEDLIAHSQDGEVTAPDDLLKAAAHITPYAALAVVSPPSPPAPAGPVDMEAIRKALRGYNPRKRPEDEGEAISKKELARRVAHGEALVQPGEVGQRDHSCNRAGFIIGRKYGHLVNDEATLLALLDMPVRSMPVYPDDDPEKDSIEARFKTVVHGWTNGCAAAEAQKKDREERKAARTKTMRELYAESMPARFGKDRQPQPAGTAVDESDGDAGETTNGKTYEEIESNWEERKKVLLRAPGKEDGEEGPLLKAGANAHDILKEEPRWFGVLRFNEVTKDVELPDAPLPEHEKHVSAVTTAVSNWLQREYSLILHPNIVQDQIYLVARSNMFDPLKDYLNGIRADEGKRIDTFLEVYCGAETEDENSNDITEYIRRVSRCVLIGAVARGLSPGCQMDNVLILEGSQGIKKSRFLRALGGKFFADSTMNITDKDSKMLVSQHWIIELAELSSLRPNETEAQKGFFSCPEDKFRPPYARAVETFPRRCICVGTTNDHKYMYDATGNRRSWPVRCRALDSRRVKKDRDLIWAEAVAEYKAGFTCPDCLASNEGDTSKEEDRCAKHRWWLTLEENKRLLESQNNHRIRSGFADVLRAWLLAQKPENRPTEMTSTMIALEALKIPPDRVESHYKAIGLATTALKMEHTRSRKGGGRRDWVYLVPKDLLTAPMTGFKEDKADSSHLRIVPNPPK